ncbi:YciI family protein [Nocardia iowensis]|uniref:Transcription initiation protein n=1 Tax=Nocardia iowensis TaxID=204891 RepID=A0ABX8RJY5_NOCIO|nr:YciI family protein [Nocardia iowensis]QXN89920.1 transcription initiation protein [Nocardia iowensis]
MYYLAAMVGRGDGPEVEPDSAGFAAEVERYAAFEAKAGAAVVGGAALYPAETAINIRRSGGRTLITDGPFTELAEVVGGFYVFEAKDLDEAIQLARQLPAAEDGAVEVRPMVQWACEGTPGADWWTALLWESPGEVIAPGTPEWDAAVAEHQRFGEQFGSAIVGGGAVQPPTTATTVRVRDDQLLLTDGPFVESAEVIDGLYLITARGRAAAEEIAAGIPIGPKGRVELRQIVDVDG